jgi:hypothetical protein
LYWVPTFGAKAAQPLTFTTRSCISNVGKSTYRGFFLRGLKVILADRIYYSWVWKDEFVRDRVEPLHLTPREGFIPNGKQHPISDCAFKLTFRSCRVLGWREVRELGFMLEKGRSLYKWHGSDPLLFRMWSPIGKSRWTPFFQLKALDGELQAIVRPVLWCDDEGRIASSSSKEKERSAEEMGRSLFFPARSHRARSGSNTRYQDPRHTWLLKGRKKNALYNYKWDNYF